MQAVRYLLLTALLLGAAACGSGTGAGGSGAPDFSYAQSGAPLYNAMSTAQQNMSNMSQYRNRPTDAAQALGQFEYILAALQSGQATVSIPPASQGLIDGADQEIRAALRIAPGTTAQTLSEGLRSYAGAFSGAGGSGMQALGAPYFTLGQRGTFLALSSLPNMPSVESASYALTRAAGTIGTTGSLRR
jgi:hypothetical protein